MNHGHCHSQLRCSSTISIHDHCSCREWQKIPPEYRKVFNSEKENEHRSMSREMTSYVIAWNQYLFSLYTSATRQIAAIPWMANMIRAAAAAVIARNSDINHWIEWEREREGKGFMCSFKSGERRNHSVSVSYAREEEEEEEEPMIWWKLIIRSGVICTYLHIPHPRIVFGLLTHLAVGNRSLKWFNSLSSNMQRRM